MDKDIDCNTAKQFTCASLRGLLAKCCFLIYSRKAWNGNASLIDALSKHGNRSYPEPSIAVQRPVNDKLLLSFGLPGDSQNFIVLALMV